MSTTSSPPITPTSVSADLSEHRPAPQPARALVAPPLVVAESVGHRTLFAVVLIGILALYAAALLLVWHPGHPGVDQNGYLVGGKYLALTGNPGFIPSNPYSFVGAMWNLGPDGKTYYPKYPLGLPAIYALLVKIFGTDRGAYLSYLVSPASAVLAVAGTYMLARPYVAGFGAVLAAMIVGMSPVTFGLANNPNSHAATLAFVVWGMVLLFSWWRSGGAWRAVLAGFLLGYALTIRYTEGLLLLPMSLVALGRIWGRGKGAWWQSPLLFLAWAVPVGALVAFNWAHFGSLTGYDSTKESTGFSWDSFVTNWDLMLREMDDKALALVLPLGLAGLAVMTAVKKGWQLSLLLASWVFPALLTYTAYYWAPESASLGYARFILTVLPGLAVAAVWLLVRSGQTIAGDSRWRLGPVVTGAVAALALANMASANADTNVPETRANLMVDLAARKIMSVATAKNSAHNSVVFSEPRVLHHLQFVSDCEVYTTSIFAVRSVSQLSNTAKNDEPHPLQPQRAAALYALLKDKSERQLIDEQNKIMDDALRAGKRVFFAGQVGSISQQKRKFLAETKYTTKVVQEWQDPAESQITRWQRTGRTPLWAGRRNNATPPPTTSGALWQVIEVTAKPPVKPTTLPLANGGVLTVPPQVAATTRMIDEQQRRRQNRQGQNRATPTPPPPASRPTTRKS